MAKLCLLLVARSVGLFWIFRLLTQSRIRILCYHGGCLGDEKKYNPKLFITPVKFELRLRWLLKKRFRIFSLDEAANLLSLSKCRPKLPTVITFDDGWYSTVHGLVPILAKLHVPSTLYLSTEYFTESRPILSVSVGYIVWRFGPKQLYLEGFNDDLDGIYELDCAEVRETLCKNVVRWISESAHSRQAVCRALERVAASGGLSPQDLALDSRRFDFLSHDELLTLESQGCSVEMHGHVHRYPAGDPIQFHRDICNCVSVIVGAGLSRPTHYCYPSGRFDSEALAVLGELGILTATTCLPGLIGIASGHERFFLPRFLDGESISSLEFEAEMSGFTDFLRSLVGRRWKRLSSARVSS